MNNLLLRTLSGVILVLIITGAILAMDITMLALVLVIFTLGIFEYHTIFRLGNKSLLYMSIIGGLGTLLLAFLLFSGNASISIAIIYLGALLTLGILFLLVSKESSLKQAGTMLFGMIWIAGSLIFFLGLGWLGEKHSYQPAFPITLLIFIWVNDVAAYLIGSAFGRHSLAPSISPAKTWEGFIGGILFSGAAGYLVFILRDEYTSAFWIAGAMLLSLSATAGDLFESKLKREAGVKDSGQLIPGHGGILDRFDSLLFSAPLFYIFILLWHLV